MLIRNDVLQYDRPALLALRVLWIDPAGDIAYTFSLNTPAALPRPARLRMLEDDVRTGNARLLLIDPCAARRAEAPPPRHLEIQARAWDIVRSLVQEQPAIYRQRERAPLLAAAAAAHGVSHATVLRYLRRYWERGQTCEALLPDYANSGAPGKTRNASAGVKRGRPRKAGSPAGFNTDTEMRATFRVAVERYAATHEQFSRRAAYRQMLDDFFGGRDPGAVPTFGQFNYWIGRDAPVSQP